MKNSESLQLVGADNLNEVLGRSWKFITAIADELSETDNYRKLAIRSKFLDLTFTRIPTGYEIMPIKETNSSIEQFTIDESSSPYVSCTFGLTELSKNRLNNAIDIHILRLEDEIINAVQKALVKKKSIFPSNREFTYTIYPRPYQDNNLRSIR